MFDFVAANWSKNGGGTVVRRVELMDVPVLFNGFKAMGTKLGEGRSSNVAGNPLNPLNHNFPEYTSGLARLRREFVASPSLPDEANVLFTYHGTKASIAKTVVKSGPRPLRTTDGGFFGAGSYTALEAEYAARYARIGGADADGNFCCLLYATVVGCAYIITRRLDYTEMPNNIGHTYIGRN